MKPIQENLKSVSIEDEETGDLMPLLDYAGQKFSSLIKSVDSIGKVGSITIKITVRPSTAGAMAVKPEVRVTMPKGLPAEAMLWPTPDGNLVAEDPRQEKLELRQVDAQKLNIHSTN